MAARPEGNAEKESLREDVSVLEARLEVAKRDFERQKHAIGESIRKLRELEELHRSLAVPSGGTIDD
jgi:hypothetical protein